MRILRGHDERITSLCYAPDGQALATASRDQSIVAWDLISGRKRFTAWHWGKDNAVVAVAWSPEDDYLAAADSLGLVTLRDAQSGAERLRLDRLARHSRAHHVTALGFTQAGGLIVAESDPYYEIEPGPHHRREAGGHLDLWDLSDGPTDPSKPSSLRRDHLPFRSTAPTLLAGPCCEEMAVARLSPGIVMWKPTAEPPGEPTADLVGRPLYERPGADRAILPTPGVIRGLTASADGRFLAAASGSLIHLWEVDSRRELASFSPCPFRDAQPRALALSYDGQQLALAQRGGLIHLYDLRAVLERTLFGNDLQRLEIRALGTLDAQLGPIDHLAFAPDDLTLAATYGPHLVLWDRDALP